MRGDGALFCLPPAVYLGYCAGELAHGRAPLLLYHGTGADVSLPGALWTALFYERAPDFGYNTRCRDTANTVYHAARAIYHAARTVYHAAGSPGAGPPPAPSPGTAVQY